MSHNLLKGKRGIIFGALNDMSIAWKVAERAHEEGAKFVLTNAPIAMRMGEINSLAEKTGSETLLSRIITLVGSAQRSKAPIQRMLSINSKAPNVGLREIKRKDAQPYQRDA